MRSSDWSSDVCSSDLLDLDEAIDPGAVDLQMNGAAANEDVPHDALQGGALCRHDRQMMRPDIGERRPVGKIGAGGGIEHDRAHAHPPAADRKSTRLNSSH